MKKFCTIITLLIFLIFTVTTYSYAEENLWLIELVVNKDYRHGQVVEAFLEDEKVFLPLLETAGILGIPVEINQIMNNYILQCPDGAEILIDEDQKLIITNYEMKEQFVRYKIKDKLYLDLSQLGKIMDANLEYNPAHLMVYISTEHIKKQNKDDLKKQILNNLKSNGVNNEKKDETNFSLSNVKYTWSGLWEKNSVTENNNNIDFNSESIDIEEDTNGEFWKSSLDIDLSGTIFDWKYKIDTSTDLEKGSNTKNDLDRFMLIYNMDKSKFQIGTLTVGRDGILELDSIGYNGVSLGSYRSPLMRMSGSLIKIKGEAPYGSRAVLYVNGWKMGMQKIDKDELYFFDNITLFEQERANEIKVVIEKPNGEIEEKYRYISIAEALLNAGEINYLAQLGRLNEEKNDIYLLNTMINWGATKNTTMGLSFYTEYELGLNNSIFNYNAFRYNQRLTEKSTFSSIFYRNDINNKEDTGYRLNLDYKNKKVNTGLEYHEEAAKLYLPEDKYIDPQKIVKIYYLQNISPNSIIEGKYSQYENIYDSEEKQDIFDLGYWVEKDRWKGSIKYKQNRNNYSYASRRDTIETYFSYLIKPNLKLINELGYEEYWNDFFNKSANIGLNGILTQENSKYIIGANLKHNINDNTNIEKYRLSWSKQWKLNENVGVNTSLEYNYQIDENDSKEEIPLKISYNHYLKNDMNIELYYQGRWNQYNNKEEDINHQIGFSVGGAFNLFSGKIVSTSTMLIDQKVGVISGVVYKDGNRNNKFDQNEEILSDIPVCLGHKTVYTDNNGRFVFDMVAAGNTYQLGFDYSQLPIELTPTVQSKNVILSPNEEVKENLGLYIIGAVDGQIKIANYDQSILLNRIEISAEPGGYKSYTDYRGYYFFDQLPVGEYKIKINDDTLPDWAELIRNTVYEIRITDKGEYVSSRDFELNIKKDYLKKYLEQKQNENKPEKVEVLKDGSAKIEKKEIEDSKNKLEDVNNLMKINLDNRSVTLKEKQISLEPFIYYDKDFWAPVRDIAEAFNAHVFWDYENKRIYIIDLNENVLFDVEMGYVMLSGKKEDLHGINIKDGHIFITLGDLKYLGFNSKVLENIIYIYPEKY